MQKITNFTHIADVFEHKPIMNYSVIHSKKSQHQLCWGNALIDEQFILSCNGNNALDDSIIDDILNGDEYYALDSVVYFFPRECANKAKSIITEKVNQWMNSQNSGINYDAEGFIYIAFRETKNGLWILTYDGSISNSFGIAEDMFNDSFTIQYAGDDNLNYSLPIVAYNFEESSGEYFFNYISDNHSSFFDFMKEQSLFDENCNLSF